jgi:hypothetical protein
MWKADKTLGSERYERMLETAPTKRKLQRLVNEGFDCFETFNIDAVLVKVFH